MRGDGQRSCSKEFRQPEVQRPSIAALDGAALASPLDFAHQLAKSLMPDADEIECRAKGQQIIDLMRADIARGELKVRRPNTGEIVRDVETKNSALWLLAYVLQKSDFLTWAVAQGFRPKDVFAVKGYPQQWNETRGKCNKDQRAALVVELRKKFATDTLCAQVVGVSTQTFNKSAGSRREWESHK